MASSSRKARKQEVKIPCTYTNKHSDKNGSLQYVCVMHIYIGKTIFSDDSMKRMDFFILSQEVRRTANMQKQGVQKDKSGVSGAQATVSAEPGLKRTDQQHPSIINII